MLLLNLNGFSQHKQIHYLNQKVHIEADLEQGVVRVVDSDGFRLHPDVEILKLDTVLFKTHKVLRIWGTDCVISWCDIYISYDTHQKGYVYNFKREEE